MILTTHTSGGLGNLLFMIANIFNLSKKYSHEIVIYKNNRDINPSNTKRKLIWEYDIFKNFKIIDSIEYNNFNKIYETGFIYNYISLNNNLNYCAHGYFQSYKYFDENKIDFINSLYNPHKDYVEKYITDIKNKYINKNIISIHFRRTDYLKRPDVHLNLPLEYYIKAMQIFNLDDVFIFFSDDIQWVKEQVVFEKFINKIYFEEENEELSLWMMASCDHNIIANSSFSLWASYLNLNPNKKTIAPSRWFGSNGPKHKIYDLIEENNNSIIIDV